MLRWALRKGIAAAFVGGIGLAASAAAQVSAQPPAVTVYTITPEWIAASAAALVALIGAVIGGWLWPAPPVVAASATGDAGPSPPW